MATKTQITVQIRPCHLQYASYDLRFAQHCLSDCVLACDGRSYAVHCGILSVATGLLERTSVMRSDPIVVHERYWSAIEHLIELIYRGETTFAREVLPVFRELNDEVNLKVSIGYHHWDMDATLDQGIPPEAQLGKQDPHVLPMEPDSKGRQDNPINPPVVNDARKEQDLGCLGVVPHT